MKKIILLVFLCWSACGACGCAKLEHMDELLTLKSLSEDQQARKQYLAQEEQKFQSLLAEVRQEKLSPGQSKTDIVSAYGTPILITEVKDDPVVKEELMYRHPGQLLGSEKVFLDFDGSNRLVKWRYQP